MQEQSEQCLICEKGHVYHQKDVNDVEYKGHKAQLALYFGVCTHCGSEQTNAEQSRLNKQQMVVFKHSVDDRLYCTL